MRCVIWGAVSSKPQLKGRDPAKQDGDEEAGDSLAEQFKDGRAVCEQRDWVVVDELSVPGHTRSYWQYHQAAEAMGAYADLQRLVEARAFDVLVCRDLDRLGRTDALLSQVQHILRENGVQIYELSNPAPLVAPDQEVSTGKLFMDAFKRAQAQGEIVRLKQRHASGMRARVRRGLHPGRVPFGWRKVSKDEPAVQIPREVATLRAMYDCYMRGWGFRRVAGYLNRRDECRPRFAASWRTTSLPPILFNPFNVGIVTWSELTATGTHEPVFTPQEWTALQAERKRRAWTRGKSAYPYSGIVRCRVCGYVMSASAHQPRSEGQRYVYYRCGAGEKEKAESRGPGHSTRVRIERIREAILAEAGRLVDPEELARECADYAAEERVTLQQKREELELALDTLGAQARKLIQAHTRWGHVSADAFDEAMTEVAKQQDGLEAALGDIVALQDELPDPEERARRLAELASDITLVLDSEDVKEANAWLARRVRTVWCEGREVVGVELV